MGQLCLKHLTYTYMTKKNSGTFVRKVNNFTLELRTFDGKKN